MIKNVFFDLDDTLYDFSRAQREALARTLVGLGYTPTDRILDRYNEINVGFWKKLETGELDRPAIKRGRFMQLAAEFQLSQAPNELNSQYETELAKGHYFLDGAEWLISELKQSGYRLYLATNGSAEIQHSRIESGGLDKIFDGIFISQEVGFYKPDKRFFEACFNAIPDFDKAQAVMLGDSLTSDIRGGKNSGILTVWFNPDQKQNSTGITPDYQLSSLYAFAELLKTL